MEELAGKVAVITGAGSGLGRAMAHRFGAARMRLVLTDIDEARLNEVGGELDDVGVAVVTQVSDVSKASQVHGLADFAYEQFGAVNVLCNNAGVAVVGSAWECSDADWAWAMGVNFWGVLHGLRAFLPRMLESGEPGHVVNTASAAGILAPPLSSAYVATKHAVVGMTLVAEVGKYYAKEVAQGIPPETVAEAVHAAILEKRFYIFTHPEMTPAFEDRFSRLVAGTNPKTRPLAEA